MLLKAWKSKTMVLQNLHQTLSYYVLTCGRVRKSSDSLLMRACILDVSCFHSKIISQKVYILNHHFGGSVFYNRTLDCLKSQPITSMKITSSVWNTQVVHMLTEFIEYLISFSWTCILNQLHNHNRNGININVNM